MSSTISSQHAKYELVRRIGKITSRVSLYKCLNNNQLCCVKSPIAENNAYQDKEVMMMRMLNDRRYVVTLYDTIDDDKGSIYVITEFCENGDLYSYLKNKNNTLDLEGAIVLMSRLIDALCYLHNKRILHGDIKPENIFLKKSFDKYLYPVIGDFEFATHLERGQKCNCTNGTRMYLPNSFFSHESHSFPIDVFGLGKCFQLITSGFEEVPGFIDVIISEMVTQNDYMRDRICEVREFFDKNIREFYPQLVEATSPFNLDDEEDA